MVTVRIDQVSISGVPCPIPAFNVDLDREEVFLDVYRPGGELYQRIKVDIRKALDQAPTCCSPGRCPKCEDTDGKAPGTHER